jgi:hypothetical protein
MSICKSVSAAAIPAAGDPTRSSAAHTGRAAADRGVDARSRPGSSSSRAAAAAPNAGGGATAHKR